MRRYLLGWAFFVGAEDVHPENKTQLATDFPFSVITTYRAPFLNRKDEDTPGRFSLLDEAQLLSKLLLEDAFLASGYGIYDTCFDTGIGWYRSGRGS
jgi:hypothetical protein